MGFWKEKLLSNSKPNMNKGSRNLTIKERRKSAGIGRFYRKYQCQLRKNQNMDMGTIWISSRWMETHMSNQIISKNSSQNFILLRKKNNLNQIHRYFYSIKKIFQFKKALKITDKSKTSFTWMKRTKTLRKIILLTP